MKASFLKLKKYLFLIFLLIFIVTFFTKENYRSVSDIVPDVLNAPIQKESPDHSPIFFERNGYSYKLFPLFDYEISGLLVSRLKYNAWYSINRTDSVFPIDLCLIWGNNVKDGEYKNKDLYFRQDVRFCFYEFYGKSKFSSEDISNNHVVVSDDFLEKIAESLSVGDQVKIKGKLVNIEAKAISKVKDFEPEVASWKTSVTRSDSNAGACEIIYLDSVEILKKGNPISSFLFKISGYGMLFLVVLFVLKIFFLPMRSR